MPSESGFPHRPSLGDPLAEFGEVPSISPVDGRVMGWYPVARPEEVADIGEQLRDQAEWWRATPLRTRIAALGRLREALDARAEELASTLSLETGKPLAESLGAEVMGSLKALSWLERHAGKALRPVRLSGRRVQEWEPYGVIGLLTPWNYPLYLSLPNIAAALVAGNTVLWKPSDLALASAHALQEVIEAAGLEPLVRMCPGDRAVGEAVVEADCDKYVLIGGIATGRSVLERLGRRLKPAIAELSGSDPFLVLGDADLELAARSAVWARVAGAGQTCMAPKRIFVVRSVYEPFLAACERRLRTLRIGHPLESTTEVGPLRTEELRQTAEALVDDALARDGRLVYGGRPWPSANGGGFYFQPALLAECHAQMRVMQEDVFAPILAVCPVDSASEAVRLANASPFALTASVWTRNRTEGMRLLRELRGSVRSLNDVLLPAAEPDTPFGGSGLSGYGRVRGVAGLLEMVQPVVLDHGPASWDPRMQLQPYQPATLDIIRGLTATTARRGLSRAQAAAQAFRAMLRYRR